MSDIGIVFAVVASTLLIDSIYARCLMMSLTNRITSAAESHRAEIDLYKKELENWKSEFEKLLDKYKQAKAEKVISQLTNQRGEK